MIIKSLKAPAFKGCDISQDFAQANLITGENFSGKTAITQAIEVGLYGCLPRHGETNALTFELCSGSEMFVRATFDDGKSNALSLTKDKNGAISRSRDEAYAFPRVLLDAGEYFSQTGQQRLQYVLERVNIKRTGYDEDKLVKDLTGFDTQDKPSQQKCVDSWAERIKESIKSRDKAPRPNIPGWMESLLKQFKDAKKKADQDTRSWTATVKTLMSQQGPEPKDVSIERDAAQQALQEAKAALLADDDKTLGLLHEERRNVENDVADIKEQLSDLETQESKMKKRTTCPTCLNSGKDWLKAWQIEHDRQEKECKAGLKTAEAELKEINAKILMISSAKANNKRHAQLEKAVVQAEEKFNALDDLHVAFKAWHETTRRIDTLKADILKAEAESTVAKHMIETLVTCQQDLAVKAFGVLLKVAKEFTTGLLPGDLAYHEQSLGYWRGKQWVEMSRETFSGTEQLLAYTALQIALCQDSPCRLVICEEMGNVHPNLLCKIVQRLLDLIKSGVIDQAFMVCPTADHYRKFISLGAVKHIEV